MMLQIAFREKRKEKRRERERERERKTKINVTTWCSGHFVQANVNQPDETNTGRGLMMPEALYFRTYPSGKLCFISERGQLAKKQRNLVPPLTCYNDLQTRIRFFFFSIPPFLSRKEHFFYLQLFPLPIFAPLRFLLPRDRPLCRRIRDGTPLLRLLNKRTLLYLPVPCLPDTSCFRQLCNQARSASGFVGRGEYRMILPYPYPFWSKELARKAMSTSYDLSIPD